MGSPKCPSHPSEGMPRSQPPVVSWTLALAQPGRRPSSHCTPSAFPRCCLRHILWTTTRPISGRHHAASSLVPSSFVRPWLGVHVDCTPDLRARLCSGGMCTATVRTHWVTITNCMGSLPMPRFRIYLGTSSALFGRVRRETLTTGTSELLTALCWLRYRCHNTCLVACNALLRGMMNRSPVDGRYPAVPIWVVMDHSLDAQLVRLAMIVCVITVECKD